MAKLTIRSSPSLATSKPETIIETVRLCLYAMHRVEEINLFGIPGSILEEICRALPKSAPQLHTLCISSRTAFSIHEDFLYNTERLQRVKLINCKISWDSQFLSGLTRLTLYSLKANSSIIQFLHALRRMPALTDLHLDDSISDYSEGASTYAIVDLPCLRVLNISSDVGALTTVLRHISFPHSTILHLTCKRYFREIEYPNFLSFLATKLFSTLAIRSLRLGAPDGIKANGLEFYFWTATLIQDCIPSPPISQSRLHLVSSKSYNYAEALTSAMNLSFLTQLQISDLVIDSET